MNVLLLGSGGREHALAWKLAQSPDLTKLYASPGNPGIAEHAELVEIKDGDHRGTIDFCLKKSIELVVIGPEAPLVDGLADNLRTMGFAVFGPDKEAARLEGSKGFTKDLCAEANIPTARYARFSSAEAALSALKEFGLPVVIKADGLAAGKGVIIAETAEDTEAAIEGMFDGDFGKAGAEIVIEEFLEGEEASFFAFIDGETVLPLGSAQDHKRVGEGDTGLNTGGMGAYSPAPVLDETLTGRVMDEIVKPTVETLAKRGTPYSGVLFAGLMLTETGPQLIEYNVRFGDPECQVLMMRLEDDLLALMVATAEGRLSEIAPPDLGKQSAMTVVMAAKGYPGTPEKGCPISGIEAAEADGVKIFHAGTSDEDGQLVASGGRVLNVTALGDTLRDAKDTAYAGIDAIDFADGFYRSDIGWRELERG
ncbi:phosphoribosylamine--glycine ligase [Parasphingopyxis sp.]|uniref:phosphoribosylamine--glycine ligase n=1 Tax=Parasphingopyxis sp. TaxID=1920299 RepID=UPI002617CD52|nr:phosphoribosylamine--glycine ligase [Parasphingopyxis sp.]